jgi:hypothetical protein
MQKQIVIRKKNRILKTRISRKNKVFIAVSKGKFLADTCCQKDGPGNEMKKFTDRRDRMCKVLRQETVWSLKSLSSIQGALSLTQ